MRSSSSRRSVRLSTIAASFALLLVSACSGSKSGGSGPGPGPGPGPDPTPTTTPVWSQVTLGDAAVETTSACAVASDGRLYCWGTSDYGALGLGDTTPHGDPQLVTTGFRSVSTSGLHTCAVAADRRLFCWGLNLVGELGFGGGDVLTPTRVGTDANWEAVATGFEFTCGLRTTGALGCWGTGAYGQLGDGQSWSTRTTPTTVTVASGTRWTAVDASWYHACGLRDDASLWCWGINNQGQLGDAVTTTPRPPVPVAGSWLAVSVRGHTTCAVKAGGSLWCWGAGYPAAGLPAGSTPTRVGGELGFVRVATGGSHVCAWKADGTAWCFGDNTVGQLGTGDADVAVTTALPSFAVTTLAAAGGTTCGVSTAGAMHCWGANGSGSVGAGTVGDHRSPVRVASGATFTSLAVTAGWTCAVGGDGRRSCAGWNGDGGLGDGSRTSRATLAPVDPDLDWTALALGSGYGLGLRAGGSLHGWSGVVGTPLWGASPTLEPLALATTATWLRIAAGHGHALAIRSDGTLYAWGANFAGQLGDTTVNASNGPVPVAGGGAWSRAAAGPDLSCGIQTNGTLHCWGSNFNGQLGIGVAPSTTPSSAEPLPVDGSTAWTRIAIGGAVCGIRAGALLCWGGSYGWAPVEVAAGTAFSEVAVGDHHFCGIASGTLRCWGINSDGRLGLGTVSTTPVDVPTQVGAAADWTDVALGESHTCGLRHGGELWCWGRAGAGQLGDGLGFYPAPQTVTLPAPP